MTRCKRIFSRCLNTPDRVVRLAGIREPMALCANCVQAAGDMGMDPQPVPQWVARQTMGEARGVDFTGRVVTA